jgi:hypothetical protein
VPFNGPRTLAVAVSVAYVIRCTVEVTPESSDPPANHPAVGVDGGAAVIPTPPLNDIPPVIDIDIFYSLY